MSTLATEELALDANETNPWAAQAARFNTAARKLDLDEGIAKILGHPARELTVHIPVQMDDGRIEVFTGYRVQHSEARGPAKGGIRYDQRRHARRGARPGELDDLEVRRGQHPLRRRQGRHRLRPPHPLQERAGAPHPPLHRRDRRRSSAPSATCPPPT